MSERSLRYSKFWLIVFLYVLILGLLFQLLILPVFFPAWHGEDGLLSGGDWNYFQKIALDLLAEMQLAGWNAWQLRPSDQAPAGIAAAMYMLTGIAKPWVILPLNALVHSTAALTLLLIVDLVTDRKKHSIVPVLPFVFFPTALLWNMQFHKDGFFILGAYLFLFGLLMFIKKSIINSLTDALKGFLAIIGGVLLIWFVRPYGVEMVLYSGVLLAAVVTIIVVFSNYKERRYLFKISLIWVAFLLSFTLSTSDTYEQFIEVEYTDLNDYNEVEPVGEISIDGIDDHAINSESATITTMDDQIAESATIEDSATWRQSKFLPGFFDEKIYQVAIMRERYLDHKPQARSNIDLNIRFSSAGDAIRYLPRALMIGLLAPFPRYWITDLNGDFSSLMRLAGGFEMLISYMAFFGVLAGVWLWRRRIELYLAVGFAIGMILSYSVVVANVGTLHRMRYGFMMIIVAIGVAAIQDLIARRKSATMKR
jgi:hypothetical protein